jgi:hypothetical protein
MNQSPSMLRATLIGGAAAGFLGGLPIVGALNCACCSLVLAGGFLAAYLYSQDCRNHGAPFSAGGGAIVGLVAGMFYAIASSVVGGLIQWAMGASVAETLEQIEDMGIEVPAEATPFLDFVTETNGLILAVLGFFFTLLVAAVFSTIGGLIGGAVFKFEPPAAGPGAPPPPRTIDVMPGAGPTPPAV